MHYLNFQSFTSPYISDLEDDLNIISIFSLNISSSLVKIMLHTQNQLPRCNGSGQDFFDRTSDQPSHRPTKRPTEVPSRSLKISILAKFLKSIYLYHGSGKKILYGMTDGPPDGQSNL